MPVLHILAALVLAAFALAAPAHAQESAPRLALVIGNQAYPGGAVPVLNRPRTDAAEVAGALGELGFTVTTLSDQDRGQIMRAVQDFAAALEKAGPQAVGFFYYAGHGASAPVPMQNGSGRENYLIPVREQIASGRDLAIAGVPLNYVTQEMSRPAVRGVFIVVDACRNDLPWTRAGGVLDPDRSFAVVGNAPPGVLIAFATPDGATTPDDGAYARILAGQLRNKAQDHADAFRNTNIAVTREPGRAGRPPVLIDQIAEKICFGTCNAGGADAAALANLERERTAFSLAAYAGTASAYRAFLQRYPTSRFADVVRRMTPANPASPAPGASADACPTIDFAVYFEWDRSNLNAAALDTIDAFAARARQCRLASVEVRSTFSLEPAGEDEEVSMDYSYVIVARRALVVRDVLVARGIPAEAITRVGLLPGSGAIGIREPLNRNAIVTATFR